MEKTKQIIQEQLKKLPPELRGAILSADIEKKLQAIVQKHRLHIDQAGALERETMLVMLGLAPYEVYSSNLKKEVALPEELAQAITHDVNEQIFMPIRESLKKLSREEPAQAPVEGKPEAPPAPSSAPPPPPQTPTPDIFREKLERQVTLPGEETNLSLKPQKEEGQRPKGYSVDPYREPTE